MIVPPTPLGSSTNVVSEVTCPTSLTVANIAAGVDGIFSAESSPTFDPLDEVKSARAPNTAPIGNNAAAARPLSSAPTNILRCLEGMAVIASHRTNHARRSLGAPVR